MRINSVDQLTAALDICPSTAGVFLEALYMQNSEREQDLHVMRLKAYGLVVVLHANP